MVHKGVQLSQFLAYAQLEVANVLLLLAESPYSHPSHCRISSNGMFGMSGIGGLLIVGKVTVLTALSNGVGAETEVGRYLSSAVVTDFVALGVSRKGLLGRDRRGCAQVRCTAHFADGSSGDGAGTGGFGLSPVTKGAQSCFHLFYIPLMTLPSTSSPKDHCSTNNCKYVY